MGGMEPLSERFYDVPTYVLCVDCSADVSVLRREDCDGSHSSGAPTEASH